MAPWVNYVYCIEDATLKELPLPLANRNKHLATPSELQRIYQAFATQGFKANPGLKLANAFSALLTLWIGRGMDLSYSETVV
ncbi:MAG TPA: hypothetical protein VMS31_19925 [Pyrinomonadaceae bacterium]|nr:hypothetical protein [Pyrinomonadaceae bacterium]